MLVPGSFQLCPLLNNNDYHRDHSLYLPRREISASSMIDTWKGFKMHHSRQLVFEWLTIAVPLHEIHDKWECNRGLTVSPGNR
jgi:hypothetical protein